MYYLLMLEKKDIQNKTPWHAEPVEKCFQTLKSSPEGLDPEEAGKRLETFGPNMLATEKKRGPVLRFLLQFHNLLIYVLLAAVVITALLQEWIDSLVILGVCVINALIGFIQEGKAEKSLESLKTMLAPEALVLRGGQRIRIEAKDLVPGDVVYLKPGDRVPADLRITECKSLRIEEAALTGESMPVSKAGNEVESGAALGDRKSMAFSGTMVVYGQGTGLVAATGLDTELGRISELLTETESIATPLIRKMNVFARHLTVAILLLAVAAFMFGVFLRGYAPADMFLAAVGLAVAAIPEGLPAIMTITLAIGVQKMARRNAIIRRLPAVETLGSVTVICSDKTGTLTRNEMTVQNIQTADELFWVAGVGYAPEGGFRLGDKEVHPGEHPVLMQALRSVLLCNEARFQEKNGQPKLEGAPTEGALLTASLKAGLDQDQENRVNPRKDILPFSSEEKFMVTLHHYESGDSVFILKGAPEKVVEKCSSQGALQDAAPLDPDFWVEQGNHMASMGQRLLAVAVKKAPAGKTAIEDEDIQQGFTMLSLFGIMDPPREEAIEAAARLKGRESDPGDAGAGIQVKMITGDHALTASAIGEKLGMGRGRKALTGQDLEKISDHDLVEVSLDVDIYARTSPEHKLRLVRALQEGGHIVAMTGDGVNDSPALKRADVGVAMGVTGTEAAEEASDMVLTDDNFASIANAVEEGRTVYDNLKKAILFILPTNGGQALVVMASILLGIGLMDEAGHFSLPITPPQILWINMVTAVTLALALAFEPPEKNVMQRPPRPVDESLVSGFLLWRISFVSLLLVVGALGHYLLILSHGASQSLASTAAINTLVMGQVFYLINSRFIEEPSWNLKGILGSRPVLVSIAVLAVLQFSFTYLPFMQFLFQTEPLGLDAWARILAFGLAVFVAVELEKAFFRSRSVTARG